MSQKTKFASLMAAATSTAGQDASTAGAKGRKVNKIQNTELDKIYINPTQHRKYFDPDEQQKLKNAIEQNGFQGSILLRPLPEALQKNAGADYEFELVYGESRTRAVKALGWETIPAVVQDLTDREVHRVRLDENLVRKDLNPLEEMDGLLEVAADELEMNPEQVLSLLDEIDNASKRGKELTGDVTRQASKLQEVLNYYKKGSLSGFRTKYRKLQRLPSDIKEAVSKSLEWSKAVEIKPIKDPEERQKVLKWAIENNPSIKEIRQKRKEIKLNTVNNNQSRLSKDANSLKNKFYKGLESVSQSEVWNDSAQQKRIEKLMAEFEKIFDIAIK